MKNEKLFYLYPDYLYYIAGGSEEEKIHENKEKQERRDSGGFQLRLPIPSKETGGSHPGWNQEDNR